MRWVLDFQHSQSTKTYEVHFLSHPHPLRHRPKPHITMYLLPKAHFRPLSLLLLALILILAHTSAVGCVAIHFDLRALVSCNSAPPPFFFLFSVRLSSSSRLHLASCYGFWQSSTSPDIRQLRTDSIALPHSSSLPLPFAPIVPYNRPCAKSDTFLCHRTTLLIAPHCHRQAYKLVLNNISGKYLFFIVFFY